MCVLRHAAPSKGVDERGSTADVFVDVVKSLGHSKVALTKDNKPATVILLSEALREF